jgi:hypothetical protein
MGVSDRFWASASDGAGNIGPTGDGVQGGDDPAEPRDLGGDGDGAFDGAEGSGESSVPPAPAPSSRRRSARGKPLDDTEDCLDDTEDWLRRLLKAGFSRSEASRLIFERMRPREEGLVRT